MGKTWKDKPAKHQKPKHRSPMPPPSSVHEDKRKKTRAQERIDLEREDREWWGEQSMRNFKGSLEE